MSALYLGFPLVYLVVVALLFDVPAGSLLRILLSPLFYVVGILAMVTGYGLLEMRRWSWYLLVPVDFLILYESALDLNEFGEANHKIMAFAVVVFAVTAVAYRLGREIRVPYFFPKIAWWESDPRYRISVPVQIRGAKGEEPTLGEILDLSLGGCFVKTRVELSQDQRVSLGFNVFGFEMECEGVIVWRTQSTVTHPKGVGIKFRAIDRQRRRHLRAIVRRLKRATRDARKERALIASSSSSADSEQNRSAS